MRLSPRTQRTEQSDKASSCCIVHEIASKKFQGGFQRRPWRTVNGPHAITEPLSVEPLRCVDDKHKHVVTTTALCSCVGLLLLEVIPSAFIPAYAPCDA